MESMIILYDANETEFTSLGIGVLTDAITCVVSEELNGAYELEMDYPISGAHYSDLEEGKIILAKPNDFQEPQPFRIYKITRPIDGEVTVYAEHISYDMSKVPVRKFSALNLTEIAYTDAQHQGKLKESQIIDSPFKFKITEDKEEGTEVTFKITHPYNMRNLLMGSDDSILKIYDGEFIFDRFDITLCNRRGVDRDFTIRYSKNMIDLEQETSSELMYTGICPYYSNTTTETKVGIGKKYKEIYISNEKVEPLIDSSDGKTIYPSNWLTYKSTGVEAITDILSLAVTNIIASEGEFQNHLVRAKRAIPQGSTEQGSYFFDATYNMAYINKNNVGGEDENWLYKDIDLTEVWQPNDNDVFRIYTPGDKLYKVYIFIQTGTKNGRATGYYRLITSDDNIEEYPPTIPSVDNTQEEKDNIITYEGDLIFVDEVRAIPKEGKTTTDVDWLQKVEEQIQVINSDPRWKVPDKGGDIIQIQGVPSKTIYKVPTTEVATMAYPIEGKKEYERDWLTLTEGGTNPIPDEELIDGRPFDVPREDTTIYKCRWSTDDNKYNHRTDTRCTYTNYEWNGQQYVVHSTANDKILTLDLSDKFKETPKNNQKFQKDLYDETMTYIKDTKLGTIKKSIKVSFVKLSSSPEYSKWKQLETVALGDVVHVIYEDLGVNEKKKVIKTEYNVLTETYDSIEIGDKGTGFVDTAITQGDSVSALTNDRNFADITTVTKLVAERIEADYIHALQAEITEAQIQTLTTTELNATIITAEKFEIDKLVASLLVADDAAIRNTLVVGDNLIVNGEVNIKNGSISISGQQRINDATTAYVNTTEGVTQYGIDWLLLHESDTEAVGLPVLGVNYKVEIDGVEYYYTWKLPDSNEQDGHYEPVTLDEDVYFEVDESGNVTANSLEITGGSISIGDNFEVTNAGILTAQGAVIEGNITATSGTIGECTIDERGKLIVPMAQVTGTLSADDIVGGTISSSEIKIGPISGTNPTEYNFEVDESGNAIARSLIIEGGTITISDGTNVFELDASGNLEANSVELTGGSIENLNITGRLHFDKNTITSYERSDSMTVLHTITITSNGHEQYAFCVLTSDHTDYTGLTVDEASDIIVDYRGWALLGGSNLENIYIDKPNHIDTYISATGELLEVSYVKSEGTLILNTPSSLGYKRPVIDYTYFSSTFTLNISESNFETDNSQVGYTTSATGLNISTTENYTSLESGIEDYIVESDIIDSTIYKYDENWISLRKNNGPALTPDSTNIYEVYNQNGTVLLGFYKWNGTTYYKISESELNCITSTGIYLYGISTTTLGTKIAGFEIDENTISSSTLETEVGISSDKDNLAFWAGKGNKYGKHPFEVSHTGKITSTSGKIGPFIITDSYLVTNEDKNKIDSLEKGLFLSPHGISFTSDGTVEIEDPETSMIFKPECATVINDTDGIYATNCIFDPFKTGIVSNQYGSGIYNCCGVSPMLPISSGGGVLESNGVKEVGLYYPFWLQQFVFVDAYSHSIQSGDTFIWKWVRGSWAEIKNSYFDDINIDSVVVTPVLGSGVDINNISDNQLEYSNKYVIQIINNPDSGEYGSDTKKVVKIRFKGQSLASPTLYFRLIIYCSIRKENL